MRGACMFNTSTIFIASILQTSLEKGICHRLKSAFKKAGDMGQFPGGYNLNNVMSSLLPGFMFGLQSQDFMKSVHRIH